MELEAVLVVVELNLNKIFLIQMKKKGKGMKFEDLSFDLMMILANECDFLSRVMLKNACPNFRDAHNCLTTEKRLVQDFNEHLCHFLFVLDSGSVICQQKNTNGRYLRIRCGFNGTVVRVDKITGAILSRLSDLVIFGSIWNPVPCVKRLKQVNRFSKIDDLYSIRWLHENVKQFYSLYPPLSSIQIKLNQKLSLIT